MLCCRYACAISGATHQVSIVISRSSTLWAFVLLRVDEQTLSISALVGHLPSAQSSLLLKHSYLHASQDERLDASLTRGDIYSSAGMISREAMKCFSEVKCAV